MVAGERPRGRANWITGAGALSVMLALGLVFFTSISTRCALAPPDSSSDGGCVTEYLIEPFGFRFGEWFGAVGAVVMTSAALSLLIGGGWLLQRFMEKRERR